MKYHSEFTKKYVSEICDELRNKNILADKFDGKTYDPENFPTLTNFLQNYIVKSQSIFTYLDDLGMINRGFCPYTGQRIDESFPSWSFMNNRRVYVSHEGYKIMKKEDDEEYERIMGTPPKPSKNLSTSNSGNSSGCYIATVCYGDEFAPEVIALKQYRDAVLSKNIFGKAFIKTYYFVSPSIAKKLKNKLKLNAFIRKNILNKIVNKIK